MSTGLIIGWVYKKGELSKRELDSWVAAITAIITFSVTFIFVYPALDTDIPFTGKITSFLLIASLIIIGVVTYYTLQFFSDSIFLVYRKIKNIQEQEILFTDNKITSTNKTWILNDDIKKLVSVNFSSGKNDELVFKGTETKPGKKSFNYSITIPIPGEQIGNAQKIYEYFKNKL